MDNKFISLEEVKAALQRLRAAKIHPHFAGYLCVKKGTSDHPEKPVVSQDFKAFFDTYLKVPGAAPKFPYLRVFTNGSPGPSNWINANVAGSYAPSSIRQNQPLGKVITVSGTGSVAAYGLVADHENAVRAHLLAGEPISALDLAIFLFRDYSFDIKVQPIDLVGLFRSEFGFDESLKSKKAFETIFVPNTTEIDVDHFFEMNGADSV